MASVDELYVRGWIAALEEMQRPDWREVYEQTTRDIAAGRGYDLDAVIRKLRRKWHPRR